MVLLISYGINWVAVLFQNFFYLKLLLKPMRTSNIPRLRSQTESRYVQTVPDGKCLCPDFRMLKIFRAFNVRSKIPMSRLSCVQNCVQLANNLNDLSRNSGVVGMITTPNEAVKYFCSLWCSVVRRGWCSLTVLDRWD